MKVIRDLFYMFCGNPRHETEEDLQPETNNPSCHQETKTTQTKAITPTAQSVKTNEPTDRQRLDAIKALNQTAIASSVIDAYGSGKADKDVKSMVETLIRLSPDARGVAIDTIKDLAKPAYSGVKRVWHNPTAEVSYESEQAARDSIRGILPEELFDQVFKVRYLYADSAGKTTDIEATAEDIKKFLGVDIKNGQSGKPNNTGK